MKLLDSETALENHRRFVRRVVENETLWSVWGVTGPRIVESLGELQPPYEPEDEDGSIAEAYIELPAPAYQDEDDDDPSESEEVVRDVYLFFSDSAYARRAVEQNWIDASVRDISLFDFLFRWLPAMHEHGELAGTNWTGALIGVEVEPLVLQRELLNKMSTESVLKYQDMLADAKAKE